MVGKTRSVRQNGAFDIPYKGGDRNKMTIECLNHVKRMANEAAKGNIEILSESTEFAETEKGESVRGGVKAVIGNSSPTSPNSFISPLIASDSILYS